jgi:hypothetical protein
MFLFFPFIYLMKDAGRPQGVFPSGFTRDVIIYSFVVPVLVAVIQATHRVTIFSSKRFHPKMAGREKI